MLKEWALIMDILPKFTRRFCPGNIWSKFLRQRSTFSSVNNVAKSHTPSVICTISSLHPWERHHMSTLPVYPTNSQSPVEWLGKIDLLLKDKEKVLIFKQGAAYHRCKCLSIKVHQNVDYNKKEGNEDIPPSTTIVDAGSKGLVCLVISSCYFRIRFS